MWIGKQIEVTHINPETKRIGMIIHLFCSHQEAVLPHNEYLCQELVRRGHKYLVDEDFIPKNTDGWQSDIGGMIHDNGNTSTT